MRRRQFRSAILFVAALTSSLLGQTKQSTQELRGSVTDQHTYTNPALGMTIDLPGEWRMLDVRSETPNDPGCTGPLCGPPDLNAVLESKPNYRLYLSGWKLSAEYLNRKRYPLDWFADIMLEGSMGRDLVPVRKHEALQLGRHPAYRLLMANRGQQTPMVIGYVSEVKGYVFLLVCATPIKPEVMQSAVEAMKLQ